MRWLVVTVALGLATVSGLRPLSADQSVHGDRFDAILPDGFRPTPGGFAREAAAPLRELLDAVGAQAMGARRVRYDLLGSPADPEAAFVARCFAVRPPESDVLGRISDEQLAAGWARFTAGRKDHVAVAPRRRTVSGLPSHELGGSEPVPGGGVRWMRYLLVHRAGEVLVLSFTASGAETARWEAAWDRLVTGLSIETPRPPSGLLQGIAAGTAIGALLTAVLLRLLARRRARRTLASQSLFGQLGATPSPRSVPVTRPRPAEGAPSFDASGGRRRPPPAFVAPDDEMDVRDVGPTALELALARRMADGGASGTTRRTPVPQPD